jgi:molybdopterin adenylyltransferase
MADERVRRTAVVITVSDSSARGEREDRSGPAVAAEIESWGGAVVATEIVPDDRETIADRLRHYADRGDVHIVVPRGGTGFAPRDVTPVATRDVVEREAPGLAELMRLRGLESTPLSHLSRGVCGIRGRTIVVNLPGSPKGAVESFTAVAKLLAHAVALLADGAGHCSG